MLLDGGQELRRFLDLVDDDRFTDPRDEPGRVVLGRRERDGVVQGDVFRLDVLRHEVPNQGRFAGLACATDKHDRCVCQ